LANRDPDSVEGVRAWARAIANPMAVINKISHFNQRTGKNQPGIDVSDVSYSFHHKQVTIMLSNAV
jgi:hypothetical protein